MILFLCPSFGLNSGVLYRAGTEGRKQVSRPLPHSQPCPSEGWGHAASHFRPSLAPRSHGGAGPAPSQRGCWERSVPPPFIKQLLCTYLVLFQALNVHFLISTTLCCCCSVAQLCPTLCYPIDCSTPGFPVLHYLLEFAQLKLMSIESLTWGRI